ncbi:MAG: PF20097 family protein [Sarcina sp.]
MTCPCCNGQMVMGKILGDRYALKWMPLDKKLVGGIFATGSIQVGTGRGLLSRPQVISAYCQSCDKMIIDMKEQ